VDHEATGIVWLEQGDVWKFGTTNNPPTRYTDTYLNSIGNYGVRMNIEFQGTESEVFAIRGYENQQLSGSESGSSCWEQDNKMSQFVAKVFDLFITADFWWETRIDQALHDLPDPRKQEWLHQGDYGPGLDGIGIVLTCRNPAWGELKRRIRLSKENKHLSMDIMLDYQRMMSLGLAGKDERRRIVVRKLRKEVPEVLRSKKIDHFDKERFIADFEKWIDSLGWI
jgi:hypothetical protein